jgi:hypothetical protein
MCKGNFLTGPGFEGWTAATSFTNPANGASLADGWSLEKGGTSGATADITREATTKDTGAYGMKVNITGAGSSDSYLRVKQSVSNYIRFSGQSVFLGVKVKVGTANKVRVSLYDGVNAVAYSSYHTGDGTWQKLTVALSCSQSLTELTAKIEIVSDFTSDPVYIDSAFLYAIESTMSQTARDALLFFGPDDPLSLLVGALTVNGTLALNGTLNLTGTFSPAGIWDGWIGANETWTYASSTTFTISGDLTGKYQKGDKIKLTQTTEKYFYIVSVSHGGGTTTVSVTGGSDYSVANAAITSPYYSKVESPQGFPDWFTYAPTWSGFSANPTGGNAKFSIKGRLCYLRYDGWSSGTSNATGFTISAPVAAAVAVQAQVALGFNNSAWLTQPSRVDLSGSTITCYIDGATNLWTASNAKNIFFSLTYQI